MILNLTYPPVVSLKTDILKESVLTYVSFIVLLFVRCPSVVSSSVSSLAAVTLQDIIKPARKRYRAAQLTEYQQMVYVRGLGKIRSSVKLADVKNTGYQYSVLCHSALSRWYTSTKCFVIVLCHVGTPVLSALS